MAKNGPIAAVARPLLSSIFVYAGYRAVQEPDALAQRAAPVTERLTPFLEATPLPDDAASLVRINGGVQVAAGSLLALGVAPRLSSLVLVGSLVPTTLAGHAFWQEEDPTAKRMQQIQFAKNLSILGGLLLALRR